MKYDKSYKEVKWNACNTETDIEQWNSIVSTYLCPGEPPFTSLHIRNTSLVKNTDIRKLKKKREAIGTTGNYSSKKASRSNI